MLFCSWFRCYSLSDDSLTGCEKFFALLSVPFRFLVKVYIPFFFFCFDLAKPYVWLFFLTNEISWNNSINRFKLILGNLSSWPGTIDKPKLLTWPNTLFWGRVSSPYEYTNPPIPSTKDVGRKLPRGVSVCIYKYLVQLCLHPFTIVNHLDPLLTCLQVT